MEHHQLALFAILEYLNELKHSPPSGVDAESLEVALDCITEASGVSLEDQHAAQKYSMKLRGLSLPDVLYEQVSSKLPEHKPKHHSVDHTQQQFSPKFVEYMQKLREKGYFNGFEEGSDGFKERVQKALEKWESKFGSVSGAQSATSAVPVSSEPSEAAKVQAEDFKKQGNAFLGEGDYEQAILCYTEAIRLNNTDAVFYSNRAAALLKLSRFEEACDDSEQACKLDPKYTKGYYRLGLAQYNLGMNELSIGTFEKAIEVDRQYNGGKMVEAIEHQMRQVRGKTSNDVGSGRGMGGPGGFDLSSMLGNPMFQQMASQFMQNPGAMEGLMKGMGGMGGNSADSVPEMSGLPANMQESMAGLANNPGLNEFMQDPELQEAIQDVQQNGMGAMMKYMSNPSIMGKLQNFISSGGLK